MRNDDQIFRKIIDQRDRLYRIAYSYVRNEQDAMDVVQEVAYKAHRHLEKLREPEYAETWLFMVTINASLDFLRKRKREEIGFSPDDKGNIDKSGQLVLVFNEGSIAPAYRGVIKFTIPSNVLSES